MEARKSQKTLSGLPGRLVRLSVHVEFNLISHD